MKQKCFINVWCWCYSLVSLLFMLVGWFSRINLNKRKEQKEPTIFLQIYKFRFQFPLPQDIIFFPNKLLKTLFIKNIIFFHSRLDIIYKILILLDRGTTPEKEKERKQWNEWVSKWMITCYYKSNYEW